MAISWIYPAKFAKIIAKNFYILYQVSSVKETGLFWEKTLKSVYVHKIDEFI